MELKKELNKNGKQELFVKIETDIWQKAQNKAFSKLHSNFEIKGFRKGKVPVEMARTKIGEAKIIDTAASELMDSAYRYALEESKLYPVKQPTVDIVKCDKNDLEFKFIFITYPDITLGAYKDIEIVKEIAAVTEEDINAKIEFEQEKNAEMKIKESAASLGDTVSIDFEGFVDGVPFEGGKAEKYSLVLGSKQFVPGFEEQIVGAKPNDEIDIKIKFPTQYVKELAGKDAIFKVKVLEITEKILPEVNDEFVLDLAIDGVKTVAELKEHYKKIIEEEKNNANEEKAIDDLIAKIVNASEVEFSDEILADSINGSYAKFLENINRSGLTEEMYFEINNESKEKLLEKFKVQAIEELKESLVLLNIFKEEKLEVTEDDISAEYVKIANHYNVDIEKVKELFKNDQQKQNLENQIFQQKIVAFLKSVNTIK